jgi:hypothetical protein
VGPFIWLAVRRTRVCAGARGGGSARQLEDACTAKRRGKAQNDVLRPCRIASWFGRTTP